jgi:hypothetical protein
MDSLEGIQGRSGLIEKQNFWFGHQSPGDRDPLLFSAAHGLRKATGTMRNIKTPKVHLR